MSQIEKALEDFKSGKLVIVTDDENRENEADLILLAEKATPEKIGFMVRHTSGVICGVINQETAIRLKLPFMVKRNQDNHSTAFTVSVDLIAGSTTGISAQERANTLRALANPKSKASDFARPGHVFPLVAVPGGIHERRGHTEAGMALCTLTGSAMSAVISELVNDDGSMMRGSQILDFASQHGISVISIEELEKVTPKNFMAPSLEFTWADLPLKNAIWQIATYTSAAGVDHAVLRYKSRPTVKPLIRIHSECLTGDVFGSMRCDCGDQLHEAIRRIEEYGEGYIIYMRDHEGRGIGLVEKINAYVLQDQGQDTVEANLSLGLEIDERNYEDAVKILEALKITKLTLITNNPAKSKALIDSGFEVIQQAIKVPSNRFNKKYLETKKSKLRHVLGDI